MGVRDPVGGPGPPAVLVLSASFSRTRGDTGPVPSGKRVRCRWSGEMEPDPWGPAALYAVVTDNYTSLDMARGGTPVLRYRHRRSSDGPCRRSSRRSACVDVADDTIGGGCRRCSGRRGTAGRYSSCGRAAGVTSSFGSREGGAGDRLGAMPSRRGLREPCCAR